MNSNDIYNQLVNEIVHARNDKIKPEHFGLSIQEFRTFIDEIENDGLFKKGYWAIDGFYIFTGLTFKGKGFIENNDKKQYHKIEKTEVNYNNNINVGGNNNGNIISGHGNTINSELNQDFDELIYEIKKSNLENKDSIIESLQITKNDPNSLKSSLINLLEKGVEASISALIGRILAI